MNSWNRRSEYQSLGGHAIMCAVCSRRGGIGPLAAVGEIYAGVLTDPWLGSTEMENWTRQCGFRSDKRYTPEDAPGKMWFTSHTWFQALKKQNYKIFANISSQFSANACHQSLSRRCVNSTGTTLNFITLLHYYKWHRGLSCLFNNKVIRPRHDLRCAFLYYIFIVQFHSYCNHIFFSA